jgi:putative MATE family efflux protein
MPNSLTIKLTTKDLLKKTSFSIGLLIFTSLYTIVDSLFISNYVNTNALAALNLAFPLITITSAFGFMFATGGSSWVSIKLGEKKEKQASKDFSLIVAFSFVVSIIIAAIIELYLTPIVHLLGATDETFNYTRQYLGIIIFMSPIFVLQILYQLFLFVNNKGKIAFRLVVLSGLVNVLFDYLFMKVFGMGIKGAAWGTSLGYLVWGVYGTYYFFCHKDGLHFTTPSKNKKIITKSISNGMSEMVTNLSSSITTYYFNFLTLKYLGTDGLAAISILLYCQFLFSSIFFGLSIGASPLVGYAWGAKKYEYTDKLIKLCFRLVLIFSILMFGISFFGSNIVTGLFCRPDNPVYDIASHGLRLFSFSFLICGISIIASTIFTAIGDGKRSAIISFLRVFIFTLLFLTILPRILGTDGIWLAIPVAEFIMIFIDAFYLLNLSKRLKELDNKYPNNLIVTS